MAEVVTGEAVVLDLTIARFPSRMAALFLDMLIQITVIALLLLIISVGLASQLDAAATAAIWSICYATVVIGYPTIFETVTRGRTPGKMALGLRVVSDDGGPVRFRQALLRALSLAFVEVWDPVLATIGMPAGLITAMISARGKRLGDMVAGTFVIQERVPSRPDLTGGFATIPLPLTGWAHNLELSRLSDTTAAAASSYLRRYYDLRPAARDELGWQLASAVAAQVSPPPPDGTPPAAYLSAVLAVRRDREQARLGAQQVTLQGTQQVTRPGPGYPAGQALQPPGVIPAFPQDAVPGGPPGTLAGYQPGILPPLPPYPAAGHAYPAMATQAAAPGRPGPARSGTDPAEPTAPAADASQVKPPPATEPDNFGFTAPV